MKKTLLLLTLSIALFLTACTTREKPPTYAELQQITGTTASETEAETEEIIYHTGLHPEKHEA